MPTCFGDLGHPRGIGRTYDDLVSDALWAQFKGWGFSWLTGRMDRGILPWDYGSLARQALPNVIRLLDIDTGGGEVLASLAPFPAAKARESASWTSTPSQQCSRSTVSSRPCPTRCRRS